MNVYTEVCSQFLYCTEQGTNAEMLAVCSFCDHLHKCFSILCFFPPFFFHVAQKGSGAHAEEVEECSDDDGAPPVLPARTELSMQLEKGPHGPARSQSFDLPESNYASLNTVRNDGGIGQCLWYACYVAETRRPKNYISPFFLSLSLSFSLSLSLSLSLSPT